MSNEVELHFLKPGMLTVVQDMGRRGYQHFGVPFGGALDRTSAKLANRLVGNRTDSPVFEITLLGPRIAFSNECQIALAGADLQPEINGSPVPMTHTLIVKDGDLLTFRRPKAGCRTYLAIGGRMIVQTWLNSASATTGASRFTSQSTIGKGSVIRFSHVQMTRPGRAENGILNGLTQPAVVRALAGPEYSLFQQEVLERFFDTDHLITKDSNRMGYRLQTRIDADPESLEIISSGIIPGTVQVTPSGQPIILLADAQTTGGYARLANVISADLDILGQLKPGESVAIDLVTLDEAKSATEHKEPDEIYILD